MPDTTTNSSDTSGAPILQLKIRLHDISPMIWRRVLVPATTTLEELHGIFQVVMGWERIHLYQFRIHAAHYGSWELGARSPDRMLDSFHFRVADKFVYTYDMTCDWQHEIRVEAWRERRPHKRYPGCIDGHGACPPEDCGGPPGYDKRKTEAQGIEAIDDLLDRIVGSGQPHLPVDTAVRGRLETLLERYRAREPFLAMRFDPRRVNQRLEMGEHHLLKRPQDG